MTYLKGFCQLKRVSGKYYRLFTVKRNIFIKENNYIIGIVIIINISMFIQFNLIQMKGRK